MATQCLFSWIHLSDVHFDTKDAQHRSDLLYIKQHVLYDIERLVPLLEPKAILVTGDIAFSGGSGPDEYRHAHEFLAEVMRLSGLRSSDVYLVPGNHDVDRGRDRDREIDLLMHSIRTRHTTLDDALDRAEDKQILTERMRGYLDFAAQYGPQNDVKLGAEPATPTLWWHTQRKLDDHDWTTLRIVGLNTAILSCGDTDKGFLQLSAKQYATGLGGPARDDELVLVLSHHPTQGGWLADEERFAKALQATSHLHLHGHLHKQRTVSMIDARDRSLVTIGAGAMHRDVKEDSALASQGYSWGQLMRTTKGVSVRVWPRRWDDELHEFRRDERQTRDRRDYSEHVILAGTRKRGSVSAVPLAVPGGRSGTGHNGHDHEGVAAEGVSVIRRTANRIVARAPEHGRIATATRSLRSLLLAMDGALDGDRDDTRLHAQQARELVQELILGKRAR
jgi:3',5'-cyclic AMP phosphodiesterase CpdA